MVLTKENLFMVTSNLLSANSPDYLLFKHNGLDWTQDKWKKKEEDTPGSIRRWGSEARRRGSPQMWLNPAAHETCVLLCISQPPLSQEGSCEPRKREEITLVTFGPRYLSVQWGNPWTLPPLFPPVHWMFSSKWPWSSKMGKTQKSTLSPQLALEQEPPGAPPTL